MTCTEWELNPHLLKLDICEGLHSHSQPCVLTSAPKGCNVKLNLRSGWHYICISNSEFRVPYTQTLTISLEVSSVKREFDIQ